MTIAVTFLSRYALPLVAASLYFYQEAEIAEQVKLYDKTLRLADQVLSVARGEGDDPVSNVFDYIIVGAGSAGSVVANRLSAFPNNRVLLLEAGGDPNPILDIPYAHDVFWETRVMDWNYTTVKQSRSCLYNFDGYCMWPRGKALGGTTAINIVLYNRGKPKDFDSWSNFTGDPSWSWENIKEAFNGIENYRGSYLEEPGAFQNHGQNGDVYVEQVDYLPGVSVLMEALAEKGIPTGDLDGGEFTSGFSRVDYNIKDGMRWGTYNSHLEPALNRSNLVIYRYATATKILFEGTRATGVEYERHGKIFRAVATREVILSGGAVESPKLLMLSGIGPREHLQSLNINVLVDLPVGQYLQDHPGINSVGAGNVGFILNTTFGMEMTNPAFVLEFVENGTGPMRSFSSTPRLMKGYLKSTLNQHVDWPELYVYVYERFGSNPDGSPKEEVYFNLELVRLSSTGTIRLASTDPKDKPLIDPNFFGESSDIEKMIDGINVMMDVFMNSTAYARHGITLFQPFELCTEGGVEYLSRDYWRCFIQQTATPHFHSTSTCRMGPDPTVAIVDSKLRVFGTQGLRVVDGSAIPFVTSGNTNMPTILIGERGASFILADQTQSCANGANNVRLSIF